MLICFALKEEAAPLRKIAVGKPGVTILLTGIGRQNAEKSVLDFFSSCRSRGNETQIERGSQPETPYVVSYEPDLVLTCGFAGGLNPALKLGDVVFELAKVPVAPSLSPQGGERVSARTGEGLNEDMRSESE